MQLLSVNIGQAREIASAKTVGKTGIYKMPVATPVVVTKLGLEGDAVCDTANHGGVDQAVYFYGAPDYTWWSAQRQTEISPGTFGENLTVSDVESASLRIGDRFQIGQVVLEVTSPRIPCITLARRMGDNSFVKQFLEAERPGVYCRVLQEGRVQAGDAVLYERFAGTTVSVLEMMRDFYVSDLSAGTLRRYLAAPIALRARADLERRLQAMQP
jgi:MOSC domain-containing protein YiiM